MGADNYVYFHLHVDFLVFSKILLNASGDLVSVVSLLGTTQKMVKSGLEML